MVTPGWVRAHRTTQHRTTALIRTDLAEQAITRVTVEHEDDEQWTPRRGMSFASD